MRDALPTRRQTLTALATLAGGSYLLGASTPALAWPFSNKPSIRGSGRLVQEKRSVAGFHAVAASLPCAVNLVQGNTEGVDIETDDNLLAAIETTVEDGELQLH